MTLAAIRAESKKIVTDPTAQVKITWTDPLIDLNIETETSESNRVSYPSQVADLITDVPKKWLSTNSGARTNAGCYPMPSTALEARIWQVGWWGYAMSNAAGSYVDGIDWPRIAVTFSARPVYGFVVSGDNKLNQYPVHFKVLIQKLVGGEYATLEEIEVTDNNQVLHSRVLASGHIVAHRMVLEIYEWSTPFAVAKITEFYSSIVRVYGPDDIMSLSILEETDSSEGTLPIGNISCNEIDLTLQNLDDQLFPSNTSADLHTLVKRNRKIEPSIGFNINGVPTMIPKGLYWSGDWKVSGQEPGASVNGRDRMELFRKATYSGFSTDPEEPAEKTYWADMSIKALLETLLDSLLPYMPDLVYEIDSALSTIVIPYAFFKRQSYFECIRQAVQAGLAYAYMDTPTDAERAGNPLCADVLRIKSFSSMFGSTADPISITQDDYETSVQPAKSEEIINSVNVTKMTFALDENGIPEEDTENRYVYSVSDTDSVKEYGILESDYRENRLIQTESQVMMIAESLVNSFKIPRKDIELQTFGDPTLRIADVVEIPEYQKGAVDVRGAFALKRISTEYDGSLRVGLTGRKGHGIG